MAVAFTPGQTIGRGDLDIFLTNAVGNAANAAEITFALFYVDPNPPNAEVLIGDPQRIPVNPQVGEYYASLMVPPGATPGTYRIRWTFRELINSPQQQVVQEFAVVTTTAVVAPGYTPAQLAMMTSLRKLLRDQCVGGEEEVELDVGGERMVARLDDLYEALNGQMLPEAQLQKLQQAFQNGLLKVQSVSPAGDIAWKRVVSVQRSEVPWETILEGRTAQGSFVLTAGHRIFNSPVHKTEMGLMKKGGAILSLVRDETFYQEFQGCQEVTKRQFMYDLTAEDWHNFSLYRSGIVISNSPDRNYHFRPPEFEGDIGQYNRVFGQIWEDDELLEYLLRSLDFYNSAPPFTQHAVPDIDRLVSDMPAWRTAILWGAITHACFALASNWVVDEFSMSSVTLVRLYLPSGDEIDVPIGEIYSICHEGEHGNER